MHAAHPRLRRSRRAVLLAACIALAGFSAGCGGDSNDDASKQLALQQARAEGRADAVAEQRAKKTAADAAAMRKELAQLRKDQKRNTTKKGGASSGSGGSGGSPSSGGSSSVKSCGGGITANSVTSCEFAQNVRDEYYSSGGSSQISTYSPVTNQAYSLTCSGSGATTCRGGNGAEVTFP